MFTIFSTPKPFKGLIAITQRNAIKSWTLLHPDCEVILFGDEEGTAEVAKELSVRHEPNVRRNEYGTPYLSYFFKRAQEIAKHNLMCYSNCDIILMDDFLDTLKQVSSWSKAFLMVGRRWDLEITKSLDFDKPGWRADLKSHGLKSGKQRPYAWIDYFAFTRDAFPEIPDFVVGRPGWDNWFIWNARVNRKLPVVDASDKIVAIHQNHDYSHHPQGMKGVWYGEEARRNSELLGGRTHFYTIENATHIFTKDEIKPNFRHWLVQAKQTPSFARHMMLNITRPIRHSLGFRQENINYIKSRIRSLIYQEREKN